VGFFRGVYVAGGNNHTISQVSVRGAGRYGIYMGGVGSRNCGIGTVFNPPPPHYTVSGNTASQQISGIVVTNSHCGLISQNTVADGSFTQGDTALFTDGDSNAITQNILVHNGKGNGLVVKGDKNRVTSNYLTVHELYGIMSMGKNNTFTANTSRYAGIADMYD